MRSDPSVAMACGLLLATMLAGCSGSTAATAGGTATAGSAGGAAERTDPQALKATGEPRNCIPNRSNVSTRPAGDSVLMFRSGTNSWFRNDLRSRCTGLRDDRTLVFRNAGSQYCELDPFTVVDPVSRMTFGVCSLGRFTPVEVPRGARF